MAIDYTTLAEELQKRGVTMDALRDPGARFGYGANTDYGQFFSPFDIEGYNQGLQALQGLEQSLMGGIEQQFGFRGEGARAGLQSNLGKIDEMGGPMSISGGAKDRLKAFARRTGSENYGNIVRETESRRTATQEQLGSQYAQLTGTLLSFLGDASGRALQIKQFDPTQAGESQGKMTTQQDIDRFMNQLPSESRMNFEQQAMGMVGSPYQQLVDLFSQYRGGTYG